MAVILTGRELKDFWNDDRNWPLDGYADDLLIHTDLRAAKHELDCYQWSKFDRPIEELPDWASVRIDHGMIFDSNGAYKKELCDAVTRWLSSRTDILTLISAQIPLEAVQAVNDAILAVGGRMLQS